MSREPDDAGLRELIGGAVSDLTPRDRLGEIRRRTSRRPVRSRSRWALVVLGAGTATAAVVGAVAVAGQLATSDSDRTDRVPATSSAPADTRAAAVYFIGSTPAGARLFREFQAVPIGGDPATLALDSLQRLEVDAGPDDPDYRTLWPDGSFAAVTVGDDWIRVEVTGVTAEPLPESDRADAVLAVQQAVHTAEAAISDALPVAFERDGAPVTSLLGIEVEQLVERARGVGAPVNISDPVEGLVVDDALSARGVVSSGASDGLAREVGWQLTGDAGPAVASGTAPVARNRWDTGEISLAGVPAGAYELSARVVLDDGEVAADTRTIVVR